MNSIIKEKYFVGFVVCTTISVRIIWLPISLQECNNPNSPLILEYSVGKFSIKIPKSAPYFVEISNTERYQDIKFDWGFSEIILDGWNDIYRAYIQINITQHSTIKWNTPHSCDVRSKQVTMLIPLTYPRVVQMVHNT